MDYDQIEIGDYIECEIVNKKDDRNLDGGILRGIVIEKTAKHRQVKLESGWCCHESDLLRTHIKATDVNVFKDGFKDGNSWCATHKNFVNLQESPTGFGATKGEAIRELISK